MILERDYIQKYRDAEANGRIGARGYLSAFMDECTMYMYNIDKGNNVLPEKYNCAWIYSKYRLKIYKQDNFIEPIHAESWVGKQTKAVVWQEVALSNNGELLAEGILEEAVLNYEKQLPERLSTIELPEDLVIDRRTSLQKFTRVKIDKDNMEYRYTHKVRYSDIDKSNHLFNLRYVSLIEDAFDMEAYDGKMISEIEIHFLSQSRYGDELKFYRSFEEETGGYIVSAFKEDGTEVVTARVIFDVQR